MRRGAQGAGHFSHATGSGARSERRSMRALRPRARSARRRALLPTRPEHALVLEHRLAAGQHPAPPHPSVPMPAPTRNTPWSLSTVS